MTRPVCPIRYSLLLLLIPTISAAQPSRESISALKQLTLDELLDVEVTTVSRQPQRLAEVASGIQVVTGELIRRSGATTLPQALRLAPNIQAAQVGSSYWTIGARGFNSNSTTSNKLLVQIDGRSVYSPLFSGTFWDTQDVFLPDVERIEVISGPGGAMWGANAVNGVISVLTKTAKDTQGTLLYAGGGNEERGFGGVRHGGRIGADGYYRVYLKHFDVDGTVRANGADARDRWVMTQGGFRADWEKTNHRLLTVQGDLYSGTIEVPNAPRGKLSGGNLLARWTQPLAGGTMTVQAYYDYAWRWAATTFADRLETVDVDAQHDFRLGEKHRIVWGLNYRFWRDYVRNTPAQAFLPPNADIQLGGVFVQDEIELVPERLRVSVGAKFEHNSYSGSDFSPSIRGAWLVAPAHTVWAAASRAVRTPSRLDRDFFQPPQAPFVVVGGDFHSEVLHAFELGWRGTVWDRFSGSLTIFHHDYADLRSLEPGSPIPFRFANGVEGESDGFELSLSGTLTRAWRWSASWTHLAQDRRPQSWSRDINRGMVEISDPENEFRLNTGFELARNIEVDLFLRRVDEVPQFANNVLSFIPAYTELDARIGWAPRENWELSLVGRNLLDSQHPEAGVPATRREIERSIYARCTWQF